MPQKLFARPVRLMLSYLAVYLVSFGLLERWDRPHHLVHCRLDDFIPFVPAAVVPYLLWFLWIPVMLFWFLHREPAVFRQLFAAIAGGNSLALAVFAVYPTAQRLRPALQGGGPFTALVRLIYRVDTPTNVCPSLHVFVSVVILLAVLQGGAPMRRSLRWGNALLCLAICGSTVLLRQHSCVDVFWGTVLAFAAWFAAGRWLQPVYGPRPPRLHRLRRLPQR